MVTKPLIQKQETTVMTDLVFKWWDYPIFAVLTAAMVAVLAYFLVYWFSRRDWLYYPLPFALMTGGLLLYLFLYQLRWLCLPIMRRPLEWILDPATALGPFCAGYQVSALPQSSPATLMTGRGRRLVDAPRSLEDSTAATVPLLTSTATLAIVGT